MTWQIMIPTVVDRPDQFKRLVDTLAPQRKYIFTCQQTTMLGVDSRGQQVTLLGQNYLDTLSTTQRVPSD